MLQFGRLCAGHLPVIFSILFFTNLGLTYVSAVLRHHVDPVFPYVSAAGDQRPESCFFSLLLNLCSMLSILIIYLRWALVDALVRGSDTLLDRLNHGSFYVGTAGGLAMMTVANFQESALVTVHLTAAFICFICGTFYMVFQGVLTLRMSPNYTNHRIATARIILAALSCVALVTAITFGTLASRTFHSFYPDLPTPRPWNRRYWQPGYDLHVVSAIAEWSMAVLHILFVLSYSRDFEKLRVLLQCDSLVAHLDHSPVWGSADDLRF